MECLKEMSVEDEAVDDENHEDVLFLREDGSRLSIEVV